MWREKMHPNSDVRSIVALLLVLLLSGCAINSEGLVPDEPVKVSRHIAKTVKIMPVAGGRDSSFGREAYITNEKFEVALSQALSESELFDAVVTAGTADFNLHSEIITLSTEGGVSPLYAIVMQYWISDPVTEAEIWRRGINSRHQVQWNEAFAGGTRIIMAVEGATQKNLTKLIRALEESELE